MRSDHRHQVIDGQTDFSGGLRLVGDLRQNEYRHCINYMIEHGDLRTRPGMTRAFPIIRDGYHEGFFFNEEDRRENDVSHTGFWFPFAFAGWLPGTIDGFAFFRFTGDARSRQIVVGNGTVYVYDNGFVSEIPTAVDLSLDEDITFVQGNNQVVMLRSNGKEPLRWFGGLQEQGFVRFTDPGTTNRIPLSSKGSYMYGRLWLIDDDDISASDSLDFDVYDEVNQFFSINRGDGDELIKILPFHETFAIAFKNRSIWALNGVNSFINKADGENLTDFVSVENVSEVVGMVGKRAYAVHGEEITFLSYKGITSLSRTQEGKLRGRDIPLSYEIQPLIDRINWTAASKACGVFYQNHLLFAVPMDGSTVNNKVLVYDLNANDKQGAWVGIWESLVMHPVEFYTDDEKLYFLGEDGVVRRMWTDDPWDSQDWYHDTPMYDPTASYKIGDLVYYSEGSSGDIYQCILAHDTEQLITNTTYWTQIADPTTLYKIESDFWSRFLEHGDEGSPKKYNRAEVTIEHQDPNIDIDIKTEDHNSTVSVFNDITYSNVAYDIAGVADWNPLNTNLDHNDPYRQDYTVKILSAGFSFNETAGYYMNIFAKHALRFIPRVLHNKRLSIRIKNTRGIVRIKSIISQGQQSFFAKRDR